MSYFSYLKELVDNANALGPQPANTVVLIGHKDNATCLRMSGPQSPNEGVATVQSFMGIFYDTAYVGPTHGGGNLQTRAIYGGNLEMDLEIQCPNQIRITAVDDSVPNGQIQCFSKTDMRFNMRADGELLSPVQLIIDRVDTGTTGVANTSDLAVKVSSGTLNFSSPTQVNGDGTNAGLQVTAANNVAIGLATDPIAANDGFPYIPFTVTGGAPSGTPTSIAGFAPMIAQNDTGTYKLWVYIPAVGWKSALLS